MNNEKELTKEELGNKIATIQKVIENDTVGNGLVILSATLDLTLLMAVKQGYLTQESAIDYLDEMENKLLKAFNMKPAISIKRGGKQ
jgi:hypothetical protein